MSVCVQARVPTNERIVGWCIKLSAGNVETKPKASHSFSRLDWPVAGWLARQRQALPMMTVTEIHIGAMLPHSLTAIEIATRCLTTKHYRGELLGGNFLLTE